jgi:tetratricopeptide (TPR) repeat protein
MSVFSIIIFVVVGSGLTLPQLLANMKVQSGFALWDKDPNSALASFTEATLIGPERSNYHDFLGVKAFDMAGDAESYPGAKSDLLSLNELAGKAAIQIEPQLAVWRYRLADREMYQVKDANDQKKANILYLYEEADQLFPGNAVILNKWALALILTGDYETAGQKLLESEKSDPAWVPTIYYRGVLSSHEGKIDEAGDLFVLSSKSNSENIGLFINFCGQVAPYGEVRLIRDALGEYAKNKSDDWTGFALLGIADVYSDDPTTAMSDFKKASLVVSDKDAALLAAIVEGSLSGYPDLHDGTEEIVKGLMERAATVR